MRKNSFLLNYNKNCSIIEGEIAYFRLIVEKAKKGTIDPLRELKLRAQLISTAKGKEKAPAAVVRYANAWLAGFEAVGEISRFKYVGSLSLPENSAAILKIQEETENITDIFSKVFIHHFAEEKINLMLPNFDILPKRVEEILKTSLDSQKYIIRTDKAPCTCDGENENCYKCFGTGYYDKKIMESITLNQGVEKKDSLKISTQASFSSDSRGGAYSIRENGRFGSLPEFDNYDSESSS